MWVRAAVPQIVQREIPWIPFYHSPTDPEKKVYVVAAMDNYQANIHGCGAHFT